MIRKSGKNRSKKANPLIVTRKSKAKKLPVVPLNRIPMTVSELEDTRREVLDELDFNGKKINDLVRARESTVGQKMGQKEFFDELNRLVNIKKDFKTRIYALNHQIDLAKRVKVDPKGEFIEIRDIEMLKEGLGHEFPLNNELDSEFKKQLKTYHINREQYERAFDGKETPFQMWDVAEQNPVSIPMNRPSIVVKTNIDNFEEFLYGDLLQESIDFQGVDGDIDPASFDPRFNPEPHSDTRT